MILWIILMDCKGHRLEIRVGTHVAAAADNTALREQRPDQNIQNACGFGGGREPSVAVSADVFFATRCSLGAHNQIKCREKDCGSTKSDWLPYYPIEASESEDFKTFCLLLLGQEDKPEEEVRARNSCKKTVWFTANLFPPCDEWNRWLYLFHEETRPSDLPQQDLLSVQHRSAINYTFENCSSSAQQRRTRDGGPPQGQDKAQVDDGVAETQIGPTPLLCRVGAVEMHATAH
ncbi:hypothetical protein OPV22_001911 [Ensete ventricosum]|uniref:Uncharacterized protein n=1 Tax=Ensete ventricosum TaxID=4639 RepID=A0AAV8RWK9_ENSVE|nr:hypothetical protein OPV22_001911 [Ensete ventricosum]